jgi:hypothetical protein
MGNLTRYSPYGELVTLGDAAGEIERATRQ